MIIIIHAARCCSNEYTDECTAVAVARVPTYRVLAGRNSQMGHIKGTARVAPRRRVLGKIGGAK